MNTTPSQSASAGGAPPGMPARLWEVAKHGARGTIPQWVRAAPDAGATAPPRIGQIARRAAQSAAAAGVVAGGIGVGIGATEGASHPVDLAHPGDGASGADHTGTGPGGGAPGADHTNTDPGTGSLTSSDSGDAPGPPGSASQGGVTLHTSGDGGHLATGLATTWRIPGHGVGGGGHGEAGVEGGHDELTVDMYQDVVVHEGTDGMFSVDAVEYVVVRDEHGHAYVFRENYHTVVPDPPGQETDLVVHETDRAQIVEHPDGSFSVTQADNSISVTVGSDGDGQHEVTVTQTESVQIGHVPHADGHDTTTLTEHEDGSTSSNQTEVVTEQTLPTKTGTHQPWVTVPEPPIAGSMTSSTAPTAVSFQVGPAEPGGGAMPAGHFPGGPVEVERPAGGAFGSASGPAALRSFEHPAEPSAAATAPDPGQAVTFAGHDQPGVGDPGSHVGIDPAVTDPAGSSVGAAAGGAGEHEEAGGVHPGSEAGWAAASSGHDPGTVIH